MMQWKLQEGYIGNSQAEKRIKKMFQTQMMLSSQYMPSTQKKKMMTTTTTTGQQKQFNKEYYCQSNNKMLKGCSNRKKIVTSKNDNKFDYSPDSTKHGAFSFSPQASKAKQTSFPQLYIDKNLNDKKKKDYQSERVRSTTLKNSFSLDKFHRGEELQRLFNGGDKDIDWWRNKGSTLSLKNDDQCWVRLANAGGMMSSSKMLSTGRNSVQLVNLDSFKDLPSPNFKRKISRLNFDKLPNRKQENGGDYQHLNIKLEQKLQQQQQPQQNTSTTSIPVKQNTTRRSVINSPKIMLKSCSESFFPKKLAKDESGILKQEQQQQQQLQQSQTSTIEQISQSLKPHSSQKYIYPKISNKIQLKKQASLSVTWPIRNIRLIKELNKARKSNTDIRNNFSIYNSPSIHTKTLRKSNFSAFSLAKKPLKK